MEKLKGHKKKWKFKIRWLITKRFNIELEVTTLWIAREIRKHIKKKLKVYKDKLDTNSILLSRTTKTTPSSTKSRITNQNNGHNNNKIILKNKFYLFFFFLLLYILLFNLMLTNTL